MPDRELLTVEPLDPKDTTGREPQGYLTVDLSEEDRAKLEPWIEAHLDQIETALQPVHSRFEEELAQLEGDMPGGDYPYPGAFRVNVPITKKKVREKANRLKQAYLDSDPIWAVGSADLPLDLTEQIEKGLDHQVDNELDLIDDLSQALFEAVLHGAGVGQPGWAYHEDVRRDVFRGRGFDGLNAATIEDLARFELTYPDWSDSKAGRWIHSQLVRGKDVDAEISYRAATVNRPEFVHVPVKDVRAYPHLNSQTNLQRSPVYGYVTTYTRLELEAYAADETIDEAVLVSRVLMQKSDETSPDDEQEDFEVARLTIRYALAGDDEPTRYKVWYERESGAVLRIRAFPWWLDQADLIFFHTRQEEPGLFKRGTAWDLKDTHTAANVTLSLYLNGADMANSMRWYVKQGSLAEAHLLNRRWSPHLPMLYRTSPDEAQSLATPTSHLPPLVQGFELMRRQADEETQTTSLQSGRESPTDPSAPAIKTQLLLAQVEPNTKEEIRSLEPGFRLLGKWLLWLFYQGKRLGWIDEIAGFPDVPDELLPEVARKLQPRALLFEFDRSQRVEANNMVLGWVTKLAPQAIPQVLRIAISQVPGWGRQVDTLNLQPLPAPMPGAPGQPTPGQPGANGAPAPGGELGGLVPTNGAPTNRLGDLVGAA